MIPDILRIHPAKYYVTISGSAIGHMSFFWKIMQLQEFSNFSTLMKQLSSSTPVLRCSFLASSLDNSLDCATNKRD